MFYDIFIRPRVSPVISLYLWGPFLSKKKSGSHDMDGKNSESDDKYQVR